MKLLVSHPGPVLLPTPTEVRVSNYAHAPSRSSPHARASRPVVNPLSNFGQAYDENIQVQRVFI